MASGSAAIRAGGAFVELFTKDTAFERGLDKARGRLSAWAGAMAKLGGISLGAGLAGLPLLGKALESLTDTTRVGEIAKALGTPVEKLSGLFGVMEAAGSGIKESIESISQFGDAINKALEGKGENAQELFRILGRTAQDFKSVDIAEGVFQLFDALRAVQDPLQRTKALALAFGTDGEKLLIPMLNKSSEELRAQAALYAQQAADVEEARQATVAYTEATAGLSRAWRAVATALAPTIRDLSGEVVPLAQNLTLLIQKNQGLVTAAAGGFAALAAGGATLLGLAAALKGVSLGLGAVTAGLAAAKAAVVFLTSPVGLATAAVGGLTYAWATQTESGQKATAALGEWAKQFGETVRLAGGGIGDALKAGDLQLAARVAFAGVQVEWTRVVVGMRAEFARFWEAGGYFDQFYAGWTGMWERAGEFMKWAILNARDQAFDALGDQLPGGRDSLVDWLLGSKGERLGVPTAGAKPDAPAPGIFDRLGQGLAGALAANDAAIKAALGKLTTAQDAFLQARVTAAFRAAFPGRGGAAGELAAAAGAGLSAAKAIAGGFLGGADSAKAMFGVADVGQKQLTTQQAMLAALQDIRRMFDVRDKLLPLETRLEFE